MNQATEAAMRICQAFMDAKAVVDGKASAATLMHKAIDPRNLLADAFKVSKAYLELTVLTGYEVKD